MIRFQFFIVQATLVFAFVHVGCDSPTTDTATNDSAKVSKPVETPSNASPALASNEDQDPGKTKWDQETAPQAKIPEDLPVYSGATAVSGSLNDRLFVFEWHTQEPKSAVMDFYREQLPEFGWEVLSEKSFGSFKATRDGKELDVWIGHEPGKPVSILIRRML